LRAADLLIFTRVELQNGLDILADLVAFGFDWCVMRIRRRRRQNGRFGYHPGMLLLIGMNAGEVAGQPIFHCHIHLIPRQQGDVDNPRGGVRHLIPSKGYY
jgi:hypothetical protein